MFAVYRYHAIFTDNPEPMLDAEATHRDHAIIEQVIADLKDSALAHLPSGKFTANAAWLACAAMAYNLTRAAGALAGGLHARARHRNAPRPPDRRPRPAGPLRRPAHPAPAPALALGSRPGRTAPSRAARPTPDRPDHRPDGPDRNQQWNSRTDRQPGHAHPPTTRKDQHNHSTGLRGGCRLSPRLRAPEFAQARAGLPGALQPGFSLHIMVDLAAAPDLLLLVTAFASAACVVDLLWSRSRADDCEKCTTLGRCRTRCGRRGAV